MHLPGKLIIQYIVASDPLGRVSHSWHPGPRLPIWCVCASAVHGRKAQEALQQELQPLSAARPARYRQRATICDKSKKMISKHILRKKDIAIVHTTIQQPPSASNTCFVQTLYNSQTKVHKAVSFSTFRPMIQPMA